MRPHGASCSGRAIPCWPSIWGSTPEALAEALGEHGSLIATVEALNGGPRRLEPLVIEKVPLPPEVEAGVSFTDIDEPITMASLEQRLAPLPRRRRLRQVALRSAATLVLLLAFVLLLRAEFDSGSRLLTHSLQYAEAHRFTWLGISGVLLAYTAASLLFVPVNLMIAATAAAFGGLLGFVYALAGSLLAATVVFGLGRGIGRDPVRRFAGRWVNAVSRRLERARPVRHDASAPDAGGAVQRGQSGRRRVRDADPRLPARQPDRHAAGARAHERVRRPARGVAAAAGDRQSRDPDRRHACGGDARPGAAAMVAAPAGAVSRPLRIASYNIHACVGVDGRQDVDRVAGVLHEIGADVIGLQEVESRPARSALDQAQVLARALEMDCIEGPLVHGQSGWYGNALLTRRAVRAVRRVVFEDRGREARGAIVVDLAGSGGAGWRVLTTHLDLHSGRRRRQFAVLLDQILPAGMPTIVIGDFNEWWPFSRGLSVLRRHAVLPFAPPTFPSRLPLFALDRMALWDCRLRGRLRRHDTALSRAASDHLPIFADVAPRADEPAASPVSDAATPAEPVAGPGSHPASARRRSGSGDG